MTNRQDKKLEPMPRSVKLGLSLFAVVFIALVLVVGKYYLPNWKGDAIFLPFAIFLGLVLVPALTAIAVRWIKKR